MTVLIGASVLGAGLVSAIFFEKSHVEELKQNLTRELNVLMFAMDWERSGDEESLMPYYTDQARRVREAADARLTFVRSDGKVLGDSESDPRDMGNHADRQEIADALRTGSGSAIRYSDTLRYNMLYVALPVKNEGGATIGVLRIAMSLSEVEAGVRQLWTYVIAGMLGLFVLGSYISYRIAGSVTRPIEKMTHVAKQIAMHNYAERVDVVRQDEMGQLALAINQMAGSLQGQVTRISENEGRLQSVLANMVSGVMMIGRDARIALVNPAAEHILGFTAHELTGKRYDAAFQSLHLAQMIRECFEQNSHTHSEVTLYYPMERIVEISITPIGQDGDFPGLLVVLHDITDIRRLERVRSEFVANVSHELKTPIAAVKGFSETLMKGAMNDPETAKSFLQIINDESDRLDRLVRGILELSKIESKRVPLRLTPVHVTAVAEQTMQMLADAANNKRIELECSVPDWIYVEADEDRLRQIVMNLLANGIGYTPEGGKVDLKAEIVEQDDVEERLRLTITDTGIGIPREDLPRIFERFYRVDKARSRQSGGTGLGLSIVKHLIDLHHGTIKVESEVGRGTRFIVELPIVHET